MSKVAYASMPIYARICLESVSHFSERLSETYGALGRSRNICSVLQLGSRSPEEDRCCWNMARKDSSASLRREQGVSGSTALLGGGSSDCRYVDIKENLDISVCIVVLYVAVEVSSETMTLAGSALPGGGGESRIGSKGSWGGDAGRLRGSAGTGGNESRTFSTGRFGLGALGA